MANTAASTSTTTNNNDDNSRALLLSKRIQQDLDSIDHFIKEFVEQFKQARDQELKARGSVRKLEELNKTVRKLKSQIVSKHKSKRADPSSGGSSNTSKQVDVNKAPKFEGTASFEKFKVSFLGLPFQLRVCLVSLLRFPENETIKKRSLIYWWIGEGILPPFLMVKETAQEKTEEDFGNQFFDELIAKSFIEPVYQKCKLFVDSCRMPLSVRSALTRVLAETKSVGFSLDEFQYWLNVNESAIDEDGPELSSIMEHIKILYLGRWRRLVTIQIEVSGKVIRSTKVPHIEVSDKFFDGLKNINHLRFLSLRGISMITELPEFILQLTNLKILDLRACYNLEVLPDGIGLLKSLTHLDMSECYFVDHMPKGLASLSELQVLKGFVIGESKDKKSCTLNDLAELPKLRKLNIYTTMKEFPTKKQLKALQGFKVLRKLTICWGGFSKATEQSTATDIRNPEIEGQGRNETEPTTSTAAQPNASPARDPTSKDAAQAQETGMKNSGIKGAGKNEAVATTSTAAQPSASPAMDPTSKDAAHSPATAIKNLGTKGEGKNEAVATTSTAAQPSASPTRDPTSVVPFPLESLEKLDLQCFPGSTTLSWLRPANLKGLKKLYIKGGKFCDLGQLRELKELWSVEILRLKYLNELKMDWEEVRELFPKLVYLEKEECPDLKNFPCDESGVWMNRTKQ